MNQIQLHFFAFLLVFGTLLAAVPTTATVVDLSPFVREYHKTIANGPNIRCGGTSARQVAEFAQLSLLHTSVQMCHAIDEANRQNFERSAALVRQVVRSVADGRLTQLQGVHEIERLLAANWQNLLANGANLWSEFTAMQRVVIAQWHALGGVEAQRIDRLVNLVSKVGKHFNGVFQRTERQLHESVTEFAAQVRRCGTPATWQQAVLDLLQAQRAILQGYTRHAQQTHEEFDREVASILSLHQRSYC